MPLEAQLDATVEAGRVELTFSVANAGAEPVTLEFDDDAAAEVVVREAGERIWSWRDERVAASPLDDQRLSPGETVVHRATWDAPPPGEYDAEGAVTAANVELSARTAFSV